jgi:hypothetical protein
MGYEWLKRNLPDYTFIENHETRNDNYGHIDHGFIMIDDETVMVNVTGMVVSRLDKSLSAILFLVEVRGSLTQSFWDLLLESRIAPSLGDDKSRSRTRSPLPLPGTPRQSIPRSIASFLARGVANLLWDKLISDLVLEGLMSKSSARILPPFPVP